MSIRTQRLQDLPAILLDIQEPFDPKEDVTRSAQEAARLQQELDRPIYRIIDLSKVDMEFSEMIVAMGNERKQAGGSSDPNITTCFVGSSDVVRMGTKALAEQDQYGKGKVSLFTSVNEAIAFIREDIRRN